MKRINSLLVPLAALFLSATAASAQRSGITITPPELYPGVNEITVTAPNGISGIEANGSDNLTFEQVGSSDGTTRRFRVVVYGGNAPAALRLAVTDGTGRRASRRIGLGVHWRLDRVNLGRVVQGAQACGAFSVRASNNEVVERVTVDNPALTVTPRESLPHRLDGEYLHYRVCFTGNVAPGVYKFPVTAWIRRSYPTAGETLYPISDTGYVVVTAKDPDGRLDDPRAVRDGDLVRSATPLPEATENPVQETPHALPNVEPQQTGPTIGRNGTPDCKPAPPPVNNDATPAAGSSTIE